MKYIDGETIDSAFGINVDDYDVKVVKGGQVDSEGCPFTTEKAHHILKNTGLKCTDVFKEVFLSTCTRVVVTNRNTDEYKGCSVTSLLRERKLYS